MAEELTKEAMQLSLLRAGLTPRDLMGVMPCNPATLYVFLRTGGGRRLTVFTFEKMKEFIDAAFNEELLPLQGVKHLKRKEVIGKMYAHWIFNKNSFKGFTAAS